MAAKLGLEMCFWATYCHKPHTVNPLSEVDLKYKSTILEVGRFIQMRPLGIIKISILLVFLGSKEDALPPLEKMFVVK